MSRLDFVKEEHPILTVLLLVPFPAALFPFPSQLPHIFSLFLSLSDLIYSYRISYHI